MKLNTNYNWFHSDKCSCSNALSERQKLTERQAAFPSESTCRCCLSNNWDRLLIKRIIVLYLFTQNYSVLQHWMYYQSVLCNNQKSQCEKPFWYLTCSEPILSQNIPHCCSYVSISQCRSLEKSPSGDHQCKFKLCVCTNLLTQTLKKGSARLTCLHLY